MTTNHANQNLHLLQSLHYPRFLLSMAMVDLGEGPRPPLFWAKKKKSRKEEKPAGQAKQNCPPAPSLAQGLDLPLNGVLSQTISPNTATALPAAVTPSDQSKSTKFKQFKGQRKFHVTSVGLPVPTTHFNVNFLSRIESLQLNPSSCAPIVSEGVMPLLSVNCSSDVLFVSNPITLHFMELQVFNHHQLPLLHQSVCMLHLLQKKTAW